MSVAEYEEATGHELSPTIMDPAWFMCRFCGRTYEMAHLYRMLPQDLLVEPECDMSEMFLHPKKRVEPKTCTCGIGSKWKVGHSGWCKLNE